MRNATEGVPYRGFGSDNVTMTERKPPAESWESFTERKIREAESKGAFANLPGFGKPIPGIDEPSDENWWIREKLRRENVNALPPVLEARLAKERTLAELHSAPTEREARRRLEDLNDLIRRAHFSHAPGPAEGVLPVDVEREIVAWREKTRG